MSNNEIVWLILILPFIAFLINGVITLFTNFKNSPFSGYLNVASIGISLILSLYLAIVGLDKNFDYQTASFQWISFGLFEVTMAIMLDELTLIMITVVTAISFLIQIYSLSYMKDDDGYSRYFSYMGLFTTAMLGLVTSRNLIQLFIFWELVGATSYLLIGFWYKKQSAIKAAKKAFLMTRVGDFGLIAGILFIAKEGSQYLDITQLYLGVQNGLFTENLIFLVGLLIVIGAIGKSAQFPLHNWLPDAMEGPTPVSALLHSATMVTAGVFIIGRVYPLIEYSESLSQLISYVGAFTLIFAASMAIVSNDIKKVLAYSSISQLGYMFLALGVGSYGAAFLHLFAHAWFKALLFLGAGSIGHAVHTFDMNLMGGLRHKMKITYFTMLLGTISLIGIFPLSGFWSKDEILIGVKSESNILLLVALVGVVMTAFYMTRMMAKTFFGDFKGGHDNIKQEDLHESPNLITYPMIALAIPSVFIGFIFSSPIDLGFIEKHSMVSFLDHNKLVFPNYEYHSIKFDFMIASVSSLLAFIGIAFSILNFRKFKLNIKPLNKLISNKYYLDYLYETLITEKLFYKYFSNLFSYIEKNIVDNFSYKLTSSLKWMANKISISQNGQLQLQSITFIGGLLIILIPYLIYLGLGGN